jgi:hypothetical protein
MQKYLRHVRVIPASALRRIDGRTYVALAGGRRYQMEIAPNGAIRLISVDTLH